MRQTALITGASVGIGFQLARQFAAAGFDLVLVARNREKLQQVASQIHSEFAVDSRIVVADLAQPQAPREIFDTTGPTIDVLVNNAGFGAIGRFDLLDLPRQLEMIQVNIASLVALTGLYLPAMIQRGSGGVLNVASTAAFQGGPWMAIYYASKAFVLSFSEAIGEEVRNTGVKVSALCPGPTHSEFRARAKMEQPGTPTGGAIPVMTAQAVAQAGFKGFMRNQRVVIPGLVNKIAATAVKFAPRTLSTRLAGKINRAK